MKKKHYGLADKKKTITVEFIRKNADWKIVRRFGHTVQLSVSYKNLDGVSSSYIAVKEYFPKGSMQIIILNSVVRYYEDNRSTIRSKKIVVPAKILKEFSNMIKKEKQEAEND